MNVHKCSQACGGCTGSPELGCQCQNSENIGKKFFMNSGKFYNHAGGIIYSHFCTSMELELELLGVPESHSGSCVSIAFFTSLSLYCATLL